MIVGCGCCDVPNARSIVACAVSRTPSEATSFASGAAVRSGRMTASSIATVTATMNAYVRTIASGVPTVKPSSPVRSAQNEKPASIAIAPAARLMKPEPRYVTTMPTAIAAIVAPVPRPSRRKRRISFTAPLEYHATGPAWSTGPVGGSRDPSARKRPDPAGCPLELELALVRERLEHVVADRRSVLVLAALELRRAERERPLERLRACQDLRRRDRVHVLAAGLVEEPDRRQELRERDDVPRIRGVLVRLVPL